jgi:hypothetical protein
LEDEYRVKQGERVHPSGMPGGVIGSEPAAEGVPDEMDAANRQLSEHLVQPVGLVGGVADWPDLDAQARVAEGIEGKGGAGAG